MKTTTYGFSVGRHLDTGTMRQRWAVIGPNDVLYFPKAYGVKAAHQLCKRLNNAEGK